MGIYKKYILAFAVIVAGLFPAYSQYSEEEVDAMLTREVEIENPVRMPVLGIGLGYFNYYGNVNNAYRSYTVGQPGYRINLAMFLSKLKKKQIIRANLVFMMGELSGSQRTVSDTSMYHNLNFKSNIYSFGLNFHYSFKPWIKGNIFEPFISAGVETLQFDSKADYFNADGLRYHYWPDGTIRDMPWNNLNPVGNIISRDYKYETDLRHENQSGLGKYSQFTVAVPVELGIDFNVSPRITLRAATSLHYAFTDLIDDKSYRAKNPDLPVYKGKSKNNIYTFSYLSLHLDLFSPPRTIKEILLTADVEDYDADIMYNDQDNDGVPDWWDQCPDTPEGIEVDENGCPFDSDGDGVPDYLDLEPDSRPGAIVDEYGVEINENTVVELLHSDAIRRSDVESYLMMHRMQNRTHRNEPLPIPEKFKRVDANGDGYISFDELLKTINDYFDGSSAYSPDDLRQLKDFFFDQ